MNFRPVFTKITIVCGSIIVDLRENFIKLTLNRYNNIQESAIFDLFSPKSLLYQPIICNARQNRSNLHYNDSQ